MCFATAVAAFYFTRSDAGAGPSVGELSQALVTSQQELMALSLEQRDYPAALAQAQELLASDAQNAEALRIRDAAQTALAQIDTAAGEARAALERGASEEAAEALGRLARAGPEPPTRGGAQRPTFGSRARSTIWMTGAGRCVYCARGSRSP